MKKLILLILALCCLTTGCSGAEAELNTSPSPAAKTRAMTYSAAAAAPSPTPVVPIINAAETIPELYQEKSLRALNSCGVFLLCTDPVEQAQGSHYNAYVTDGNGNLVQLESKTFNNAYTIGGGRYHFNFNWVENGNTKVLTYISGETNASILNLSDDGSKSLFLLKDHLSADGSTIYNYYPVVLDFDLGDINDLLSKCKLGNVSKISNIAISDDGNGLLLAQDGGALYYCDIANGQIYSLDELSGEPVTACTLTQDRILCWNQSVSGNGIGEIGNYHFWYIDLATFQRMEMPQLQLETDPGPLRFAHLAGFSSSLRNSRMFSGSPYALCASGSGQMYVLDIYSWSLSPISGYTLPVSNITCRGSLDGQRLLLEDLGNNSAYVIDYPSCRLVRLNIKDAESLSWFDFDTILEQPKDGNFYLYNLE